MEDNTTRDSDISSERESNFEENQPPGTVEKPTPRSKPSMVNHLAKEEIQMREIELLKLLEDKESLIESDRENAAEELGSIEREINKQKKLLKLKKEMFE